MERWKNDEVDVEHLHQQNPRSHVTELARMFLDRAQQQNGEWSEETAEHQQHAQSPPRLRVSSQKILDLFRNVRVPNQHVLAEADVGPENTEGEHPLSHDVVMLERDHVLEITGALERGDHEHKQRHRTAGRAGENVNAEHGREPAVVEAHQPIERAEGQTKGEQWQTGERDFAQTNGESRIAVLVLPDRKAAQQLGRNDEETEEKRRAKDKEIEIYIGALGIEVRFFPRHDVHPGVAMLPQEQDRDEKGPT